MLWPILIFVSVFKQAFSVLLRRVMLRNTKYDAFAYAVMFQLTVGIAVGAYAFSVGFVLPDFQKFGVVIAITIVLYALANAITVPALQRLEASVFTVFSATSSLWMMLIGALIFNDGIDLLQLVGIALVFVSIGLIVDYRKKYRMRRQDVLLGLAIGMVYGLAGTGWVYVGRDSDAASWISLSFLLPALLMLLIRPQTVTHMKVFFDKQTFVRMGVIGVVFAISTVTALLSYKQGNYNVIAALQQTSIILTTVLAIIFLKERSGLVRKIVATSTCFVAVLFFI